MCTMIVERSEISGSGRGLKGWFTLGQAVVSYDHPFHMPSEHAVNIDFMNESDGPDARVAVELSADSARRLAELILAALAKGKHLERSLFAS